MSLHKVCMLIDVIFADLNDVQVVLLQLCDMKYDDLIDRLVDELRLGPNYLYDFFVKCYSRRDFTSAATFLQKVPDAYTHHEFLQQCLYRFEGLPGEIELCRIIQRIINFDPIIALEKAIIMTNINHIKMAIGISPDPYGRVKSYLFRYVKNINQTILNALISDQRITEHQIQELYNKAPKDIKSMLEIARNQRYSS